MLKRRVETWDEPRSVKVIKQKIESEKEYMKKTIILMELK